jgi:alpha-glucosidase
MRLSALTSDSLAFLPVLIDVGSQKKAVVLEADLQDYPGMYVTGKNQGLRGVFAKYPTMENMGGYNNINYIVNKRAEYIARTSGTRSFPSAMRTCNWRIMISCKN